MTEERAVEIPQDRGLVVHGDLVVPHGARGVVLFAHGSGSSRHSPRNRMVADALRRRGLATLLMDLLTTEEEILDLRTRALRFDIELLAARLLGAVSWLRDQDATSASPIGLFGASTGAGAALVTAGLEPTEIDAVVSRGGRPDLAGGLLPRVQAPTLLIVGGLDEAVIDLNRDAHAQMRSERRIDIVAGASHLFEEPGALEQVADLAGDWFARHLTAPLTAAPQQSR